MLPRALNGWRAGVVYRIMKNRVVLLIFVSGKVVMTGGKTPNEIYEAFEYLWPHLQQVSESEFFFFLQKKMLTMLAAVSQIDSSTTN